MSQAKTCTKCGEAKPLTAFFRRKQGRDGYNAQCKACVEKTPEQREQARVKALEWWRNNRERAMRNRLASERRHPERKAAKTAVYNALKRGDLTRRPCAVCGVEPTEAHHEDYTKPLEVCWLCRTHHAEADVERRRRLMA